MTLGYRHNKYCIPFFHVRCDKNHLRRYVHIYMSWTLWYHTYNLLNECHEEPKHRPWISVREVAQRRRRRRPNATTNQRCHGNIDPRPSVAETSLSIQCTSNKTYLKGSRQRYRRGAKTVAARLHNKEIPTRSRVELGLELDRLMMNGKGSNAEGGSRVLEVVKLVRIYIVMYRQITTRARRWKDKHSGHVLQRAWKLLSRRGISHKE